MLPPKMDTGMAPGLVSGVRWADYTTGVRSLGGVSRGVYRRGNMGIAVEWKISDAATSGISGLDTGRGFPLSPSILGSLAM